jgi:hypothetical protein
VTNVFLARWAFVWRIQGIERPIRRPSAFARASQENHRRSTGLFQQPVRLPIRLLLLAGTVGVVMENIENIGRRVLVLTGGLAELRGGKLTTCHWEDIEGIWQQIATRTGPFFSHTKHNYRVRVRGGTEHVFTHRLTGIEALRDALLERGR